MMFEEVRLTLVDFACMPQIVWLRVHILQSSEQQHPRRCLRHTRMRAYLLQRFEHTRDGSVKTQVHAACLHIIDPLSHIGCVKTETPLGPLLARPRSAAPAPAPAPSF